jgi:hypothetical protein
MPCSRHGKPRHVSLNARRFQKGEWESLWNQTLKHNNRELAHRAKKLAGNLPAPASIRARARYAEYCARKGALSKANQAMTSDMTPSAAPTNINELRAKNPEPTHPARDPTPQPAPLIWPQKADTGAWWEEEDGQEYIQKHFSVKHIANIIKPMQAAHTLDLCSALRAHLVLECTASRHKRQPICSSLLCIAGQERIE